jgi:hypothetical protein
MGKMLLAAIIPLFAASFACAEYFYLKNGDEINGKIVSETTSSVTIAVAGSGAKKTIPINDIWEISATKKKVAPKPADVYKTSEAKTEFTSSNKPDSSSADEHIVDNKSGVVIYGVTKTAETVKTSPAKTSGSQDSSSPIVSTSDDDFDAAAYLLGGSDSSKKTTSTQSSTASPSKSSTAKKASVKKDVLPANNPDDFDAAAYLLGNSAGSSSASPSSTVSSQPAGNEKKTKGVTQDDDFDAAAFLLAGSGSSSQNSKQEKVLRESSAVVSSDSGDDFDAAAYLLGDLAKSPAAPVKKSRASDDNFDAAAFLLEQGDKEAEEAEAKAKALLESFREEGNSRYYDDESYDASKYKVKEAGYGSSSNYSGKPENETLIAVSFDLKGAVNFNGSRIVADATVPLPENSDYGVSIAAEHYAYVNNIFAVGLGIGYEFQRCFDENSGRYGFLPVYAVLKARLISGENYHAYAAAHIGYSHLISGDNSYVWQEESKGGFYYAGGIGASYKRFVIQLLYCVSNGSLQNSYVATEIDKDTGNTVSSQEYKLKGDIRFSKLGFYFGYLF